MSCPPMWSFSSKVLYRILDQYAGSYHQQQDTIEKQLTAHFTGDKVYAAAIAREIMMYGG